MTLSVRYNYSAKSKTLYCPLTLFSVLNVQLIWKYSHYHLPQLNHFFCHIQLWFIWSLSSRLFKLFLSTLFSFSHGSVHWDINPLKYYSSFPSSPSKNWDPVKPPLFENLVGGSTPRNRKGVNTMHDIHHKYDEHHSAQF